MESVVDDRRRSPGSCLGTRLRASASRRNGERRTAVQRLNCGDRLILVPDPDGVENPSVWVHAIGGDVIGHLSPDVNRWLVPKMLDGARYSAVVKELGANEAESWKRLVITISRLMV